MTRPPATAYRFDEPTLALLNRLAADFGGNRTETIRAALVALYRTAADAWPVDPRADVEAIVAALEGAR